MSNLRSVRIAERMTGNSVSLHEAGAQHVADTGLAVDSREAAE